MIGCKSAAALCAALLIATATMSAAEGENPAGKTGKWTFSMNEPGPEMKKLGAPRLKALRGHLQEVARMISSSPAMTPPKGFEARFWGSANGKDRFDICRGKKCPPARPNGVLAMMIGSYEDVNGKTRAAFNKASTMDISVNNLGHVFAHLPVLYRDNEGFLLPEPQRDGERQGIPAYSNNGHVVAVLSRNPAPFWLPVNRERYLKAAIATLGSQLASVEGQAGKHILVEEGRSWIDPANEKVWVEKSRSITGEIREATDKLAERMRRLQEELAALTPEQRQQQARVDTASPGEGGSPPLLPLESSGGVGVVTPNFEFFNRKLPADAVQLVTLQWKFDGTPVFDPDKTGMAENLQNSKLLEIYRTVEWKKLADKLQLR
ncbi:MAG TPA: hypothetical protein VFF53_09950 [Geobacteraceae bacterium]|nr:hypothetical protein [Geobacteraceae bacterium]